MTSPAKTEALESRPAPRERAAGREGPHALRIGDLALPGRWLMAPLAGVTDWPFRSIALEQGATVSYTEMVSAEGLVRGGAATVRLLDKAPGEYPFAPQIFGSNPDTVAEAAAIVERMGADIVDLNMGCPVKKVCRSGAGAALLLHPELIERIVTGVKLRVSIPVQVKVRLGWDAQTINILEVARRAEDAGADAIVIHGRTRAQGYSGTASWELIEAAKRAARRAKVIGNGDVSTASQALERLARHGVDGVMIGRAACGNPWIFREIEALAAGAPVPAPPSHDEWRATIDAHLERLIECLDGDAERAVRRLRKHLVWYSRGRPGSVTFRGELGRLSTPADVAACLDRHLPAPT